MPGEGNAIAQSPDVSFSRPVSGFHVRIQPGRGGLLTDLAELWRFRDLFWTLAGRDLKLRYRQTALGVTWIVLQPLIAAAIFAFVFGRVAHMPSEGVPYFVFAFAGMLGWNLFSSALSRSAASLVPNAQLISKSYFPRLVLPLCAVPAALTDFGGSLGMLALIMAAHGMAPGQGLALLPIWAALLLMLALGIGLCASALSVTYRDVQHVVPVFTQMLLYASPVAYAVSAVPPQYRGYYYLNPLAPLLDGFRWSLLGTGQPEWGYVSYSAVVAAALVAGGIVSFRARERKFADVI